jgi:hypothetical protein
MGMQVLYKDGKKCLADNRQVDAMKKGGWSLKAPKNLKKEAKK